MKLDHRIPRFLGHLAMLAGTILLGFAIATTHQTVLGQGAEQKSQAAANKVKVKPDQAAPAQPASAQPASGKRHGRRGHALGMTVAAQGQEGLTIANAEEGGIAARAGLKQGDRIISADNRSFQHARQFEAYLASHGGRPIPIVFTRDGQQQTIMYTPPHRAGDSAWLGVFLEEGDSATKGARITQVYPGGPAARAGLHTGDLVTQVDDLAIESPADLISAMADAAPQSQSNFTVLRDQNEQKIAVTLGAYQHFMPDNGNGAANGHPDNGQYQPGHDALSGVPPYAMQLEHDRRAAEQHERIEQEIRALREEIRQLREELKQKK